MNGTSSRCHDQSEGMLKEYREAADARLVAALGNGDGEALAGIVRRYSRLVHRVAIDMLHDTAEAEDVAQDVFLEIYRNARQYDPARGSVKVWLLQYAYHRTLRRKQMLSRRAAYRGEPLEYADEQPSSGRRQLTPEERRLVIRSGLERLPERQRATLEMACFEELSLRDVAKRLRVSLGSARHYYYRGLARLRQWALDRPIARHERHGKRQPRVKVGRV
jgi:RNA polymerase sigma-70 factor (ECF subfamily)